MLRSCSWLSTPSQGHLPDQQAKFLTRQFDCKFGEDDYTTTLTLGNSDLIGESVIMVVHFLQSLTQRLVLSGELMKKGPSRM